MQFAHTRFFNNITIYTESRAAAGTVTGKLSIRCRNEIRDAQESCTKREKLAYISDGRIFAQWIPSQTEVLVNEEADSLTRAGARTANSVPIEAKPSHTLVQVYIISRRK